MDPDITRIQRDGAQARAMGLSESDNPFYKVAAMPALSGDTIEEWRLKAEAWRLGYAAPNGDIAQSHSAIDPQAAWRDVGDRV